MVLNIKRKSKLLCMGKQNAKGGANGSLKGSRLNKYMQGGKRDRRPKVSEGPQFEVTGTHVVILVGALFALAWLAGLLPDP